MPRHLGVLVGIAMIAAGCDRKPQSKPADQPAATPTPPVVASQTPPPTPTPEPKPTPVPTPYVPYKQLQTGTIFNGVTYKTHFETLPGTTATADRNSSDSYTVEVNVKVKIPKPHQSLEELRKLNDRIHEVLPGLEAMLASAKVSPEFDNLYRNKTNSVRNSLSRLDQLLSRHNFYDCETILQLEHAPTKRRALLIQADMDVDTDGSDGDRVFAADGTQSSTYQPFTSYRWGKKTPVPNPCVPIWQRRIADNEAKARDPKTPAAEASRLKADASRLRAEIKELERFSFLIGGADPFIVLPTPMFSRGKTGYTPGIGDYCLVIVGNVLYPAIIGDAGPIAKMGEASLRLCKQVNARSNPAFRAVSDLKATYLVFPGTADRPFASPNLQQWHARCEELLKDFGGHAGELHKWEDVTRPVIPPLPVAISIPTTPPTMVPTALLQPQSSAVATNGSNGTQ